MIRMSSSAMFLRAEEGNGRTWTGCLVCLQREKSKDVLIFLAVFLRLRFAGKPEPTLKHIELFFHFAKSFHNIAFQLCLCSMTVTDVSKEQRLSYLLLFRLTYYPVEACSMSFWNIYDHLSSCTYPWTIRRRCECLPPWKSEDSYF